MKEKTIGIICAMQKEADAILHAMTNLREEKEGIITFYRGNIAKKDVILCICGIGKVLAALYTEAMIETYHPQVILNSGVAGALREGLGVFDVVISEKLVQHDMDTTFLGDAPGYLSGVGRVFVPADERLSKEVLLTAKARGLSACLGTIASGDQFIASAKIGARIRETFDADACEMEGAAVALAAYLHKIPFCVIRTISDAVGANNGMDYPTFSAKASRRSAQLLLALLEKE